MVLNIIGSAIIKSLMAPHLRKADAALEVNWRRTCLNLNKRSENGIKQMVNNSMIITV